MNLLRTAIFISFFIVVSQVELLDKYRFLRALRFIYREALNISYKQVGNKQAWYYIQYLNSTTEN
ncbi:hypothetical protein [Alteromonas hispanica]|uniref:hypothetical protein n=1 Tax=Alteromonas hispanica TaxID=315421 RepID=UPI001941D523|nr:hypothetical protein [Alteromonas hispanica]